MTQEVDEMTVVGTLVCKLSCASYGKCKVTLPFFPLYKCEFVYILVCMCYIYIYPYVYHVER